MNFRFFTICIILIIIQLAILLADLGLIPIPYFQSQKTNVSQKEIGHIQRHQNDVKLKGHQQILWNKVKDKKKLYALDKVLTHENSSIKLKFNNDAEISVSEQTLLVIQEPKLTKDEGLSIAFSYGQFDAKTGLTPLSINKDQMNFKLSKNSKVRFHSDKDQKVIITVDEGQLEIKSEGKKQTVQKDSKVFIDQNQKIKTLKVSNNLKWNLKSKTIYSHKFPVNLNLEWTGEAKKFKTLKPSKSESTFETKNQNSKKLSLNPGHYLFALENNSNTSEYLDIKIVRAPKIFYYSPYTRDRLSTQKKASFNWEDIGAKSYTLEFSKNRAFNKIEHSETTGDTYLKAMPKIRGRFFWRVTAKDQNGFTVPAFYYNEIYLQDKLLKAPKAIKLRAPAQDKKQDSTRYFKNNCSSLILCILNIFTPKAYAEQSEKQVNLSWSVVNGANEYILEIAYDPYFYELYKTVNIKNNYYSIKSTTPQVLYWRVAAQSDELLGEFSKIQKIEHDKWVNTEETALVVKIKKQTSLTPPKDQKPVEVKNTNTNTNTNTNIDSTSESEKLKKLFIQQKTFWSFGYSTGYEYQSFKHDKDDFTFTSKGYIPVAIDFSLNKKTFPQYFTLKLQWAAVSSDDLVFQETLDNLYINSHLLISPQWGVYIDSRPVYSRLNFESLESNANFFAGLRYQHKYFGLNFGFGDNSIAQLKLDYSYNLYNYNSIDFNLLTELDTLISENIFSSRAFIGLQLKFKKD